MDIQTTVTVRKYAQAFLNVFGDTLAMADLDRFAELEMLFAGKRPTLALLGVMRGTMDEKINAIGRITSSVAVPVCMTALYRLVVTTNHCVLLADILKQIGVLYREKKSLVCFDVQSSHAVSLEDAANIKHFIERQTKTTVICTYRINAELIAGIRLRSETFLWEYSIRKQIRQLSRAACR